MCLFDHARGRRSFLKIYEKDWLLHGAIETDEKMAADIAGPGYHISRSNL